MTTIDQLRQIAARLDGDASSVSEDEENLLQAVRDARGGTNASALADLDQIARATDGSGRVWVSGGSMSLNDMTARIRANLAPSASPRAGSTAAADIASIMGRSALNRGTDPEYVRWLGRESRYEPGVENFYVALRHATGRSVEDLRGMERPELADLVESLPAGLHELWRSTQETIPGLEPDGQPGRDTIPAVEAAAAEAGMSVRDYILNANGAATVEPPAADGDATLGAEADLTADETVLENPNLMPADALLDSDTDGDATVTDGDATVTDGDATATDGDATVTDADAVVPLADGQPVDEVAALRGTVENEIGELAAQAGQLLTLFGDVEAAVTESVAADEFELPEGLETVEQLNGWLAGARSETIRLLSELGEPDPATMSQDELIALQAGLTQVSQWFAQYEQDLATVQRAALPRTPTVEQLPDLLQLGGAEGPNAEAAMAAHRAGLEALEPDARVSYLSGLSADDLARVGEDAARLFPGADELGSDAVMQAYELGLQLQSLGHSVELPLPAAPSAEQLPEILRLASDGGPTAEAALAAHRAGLEALDPEARLAYLSGVVTTPASQHMSLLADDVAALLPRPGQVAEMSPEAQAHAFTLATHLRRIERPVSVESYRTAMSPEAITAFWAQSNRAALTGDELSALTLSALQAGVSPAIVAERSEAYSSSREERIEYLRSTLEGIRSAELSVAVREPMLSALLGMIDLERLDAAAEPATQAAIVRETAMILAAAIDEVQHDVRRGEPIPEREGWRDYTAISAPTPGRQTVTSEIYAVLRTLEGRGFATQQQDLLRLFGETLHENSSVVRGLERSDYGRFHNNYTNINYDRSPWAWKALSPDGIDGYGPSNLVDFAEALEPLIFGGQGR